jgi:hypothetical protein
MAGNELARRRAAARKTAWKLAVVALVIFGMFILSGVLGR